LEFRDGDAEKALALAREALAAERAGGHTLRIGHSLSNITAYLVASEQYDEARAHAREALALARGGYVEVVIAWTLQHLAAVAALRPAQNDADAERAARLLGFVDARFSALDAVLEYTEAQEHDKLVAALRAALGEERLATCCEEGGAWNLDRAVTEALLV
jgi:hypothetical protein